MQFRDKFKFRSNNGWKEILLVKIKRKLFW
jgi:hypothetical protein